MPQTRALTSPIKKLLYFPQSRRLRHHELHLGGRGCPVSVGSGEQSQFTRGLYTVYIPSWQSVNNSHRQKRQHGGHQDLPWRRSPLALCTGPAQALSQQRQE